MTNLILRGFLYASIGTGAVAGGAGDKAPATQPAPRTVAGSIPDNAGSTVQGLGHQGCLVIRSVARWNEIVKMLVAAGWKMPAQNASAEVDFEREMGVLVFRYGDIADRFSCRAWLREGDKGRLDLVMSYVIYKTSVEVERAFNFILLTIPRCAEVAVTVSTYHPLNGDLDATPEKARLEWSRTIGPQTGDVVDGLEAGIAPQKKAVKPSEDILVKFTLAFVQNGLVKDGRFAEGRDQAYVWDGKYSRGYRNHAFLVTTPDGRTQMLRPAEISAWDKNAPHPVAVSAGKPYVLPSWQEGVEFKSLKAHGLDTSRAGRYVITGIYTEQASKDAPRGTAQPMWGGTVATAPVVVDVAP